ncbi:hypothetical protein V1504DRAFT_465074 [Lipomyces starkeyi]
MVFGAKLGMKLGMKLGSMNNLNFLQYVASCPHPRFKVGDTQAVADHMYELLMEGEKYKAFSDYAKTSVSDEVDTVGNALAWLYMFNELAHNRELVPNGKCDMMRESIGLSWKDTENRLPRILFN